MEILTDVPRVAIDAHHLDFSFVELKERGGTRTLKITLNQLSVYNAVVILRGIKTPRPIIHQVMMNSLEALGANLERVLVTDFVDNVYHASLSLRKKSDTYSIDAHITDALALALIKNCPIYIDEEVFDKVEKFRTGFGSGISNEETVKMLSQLDPGKPES